MTQSIHCGSCNADTLARNVADLIDGHTNDQGRFCCGRCGGTDTALRRPKGYGSDGASDSWIRGALPISTKFPDAACAPFVFLTAESPDGDVTGIAFKYYRNTPSKAARGKGSRRPDGGPVLAQSQLLSLVGRLATIGVISSGDWRTLIRTSHAEAS
ncbi:MAG TPA: hypothetical protein VD793_09335 [Gemmatimonadales bacterium]|nr:hypothetical protein [Gemmatimonadales bacterium]